MEFETVQNAIKEAERFIRVAKQVKKEGPYICGDGTRFIERMPNHRANAACKRASLDLSNILADMRRDR
jgi:hypothetical protein